MDSCNSSTERTGGCQPSGGAESEIGSSQHKRRKNQTDPASPSPSQPASVATYTHETAPRSSWKKEHLPPEGARPESWATRWFTQIKSWVTLSDPSTKDWNTHRKELFSERGISYNDPRRHAKLGAPTGEIPPEAKRPRSTKSWRKRSNEVPPFRRSQSLEPPRTSQTGSGSSGTAVNPITPWENYNKDGPKY